MDILTQLVDIILHLDVHLLQLAQDYGVWVYAILFLIIFAETGLVIAPFLPGDSLLFVAGALCGLGALQFEWLLPLLMLAAFSGDNTNYWIGRILGLRLFEHLNGRFIKREHLAKTHTFYEKHGGKTIIFARFLPIVRTFAPFVAGVGVMRYRLFVTFSALGSFAWIGSLTVAGYFFGNIPVVKNNLTLFIVGIVVLSFLPALIEFIRQQMADKLSCPKCGEMSIKGGFNTWQVIVSICFFPVGLLSLLAGRKPTICPKCGHSWQA